MYAPKHFQEQSLERLRQYFLRAKKLGANTAFYVLTQIPYREVPLLPGLPYVCIRIPTGGGKTFVATHAVGIAAKEFLDSDQCVVLWLVPTTTIRDQTLTALRDRKHPYRQALDAAFGGRITVMDISEAMYVQRGTLDGETCVIVSTLSAHRIQDVDERKVYETNGALMSHFENLGDAQLSHLEKDDNGIVRKSLANVLRLRRPVVIMDEAHNARTALSFETLARFRPSCIIEFTATPDTDRTPSNVLWSVSAAELKSEEMIKLPIRLQTKETWTEIVSDAVQTRAWLWEKAKAEQKVSGEYIRPIVLFQAQPSYKDRESVTVETLKATLIDDHKIAEKEIAVATGETRGIEDTDLFDPQCPINYIITIQALKEGWDCSFAYVLCSVSEVSSPTAVEQILGRILRLPHTLRKQNPELNLAYAHVSSTRFDETARCLKDALVANGFARHETEQMVVGGRIDTPPLEGLFEKVSVRLTAPPNLKKLPVELKEKITYDAVECTISTTAVLTVREKDHLQASVKTKEDKAAMEELFKNSRRETPRVLSPAEQGIQLSIPLLAISVDGQPEIFEESHFHEGEWKLSDCDPALSETEFATVRPGGRVGEIDVDQQGKIGIEFVGALHEQLKLLVDDRNWTAAELAIWLDARIEHPDVGQTESTLFLQRVVEGLIEKRSIPLQHLIVDKYRLKSAAVEKIESHRKAAKTHAFQQMLLPDCKTPLSADAGLCFAFDPDTYPANRLYKGPYKFPKHYYTDVGDMNSEEASCAFYIETLSEVKCWLRNIEHQPQKSFWLQTSTDKFYPDFVALLNDGRWLVVEYKGRQFMGGLDAEEKRMIGELWAARSPGRCIFLMISEGDLEKIRVAVSARPS